MSIVETVKRICMEEAKRLTGAEVIAPLAVWDNTQGSMGVQIKAPKQMGPQACETVAGFTLSPAELKQGNSIRLKAAVAVSGMLHDVQVQIRPLQKLKDVAPEALLGKPHAD
jgi:hypothetical protein